MMFDLLFYVLGLDSLESRIKMGIIEDLGLKKLFAICYLKLFVLICLKFSITGVERMSTKPVSDQ